MIIPIPLINPDKTGYGMYFMYFPIFKKPKIIWKTPDSKKVSKIIPRAFSKFPACAIAVDTITAETTVIGPVGPLIWLFVPPKIAAKNPRNIAPYNPALAPNPDCTPKARAKGKATTPAVNPPKISPLILLNFIFLILISEGLNNFNKSFSIDSIEHAGKGC